MLKFKKCAHWYLLGAFLLSAAVIWQAASSTGARAGSLTLFVFDIGQGDAIFIESPSGNQILVDGGPDDALPARLSEVMPFWDHSIDLIVLTHPHADHLDGLLAVLKRYDVGMVLESGVNHTIPEYGEWASELARRRITRVVGRRGQLVRLGGGAALRVLAPFRDYDGASVKNVHEATLVTELVFASSTALLMGDAEAALERQIVASGDDLHAEVLKVGHHGSKTSTSAALLAAVRPKFAVISVGRKNRYGHPHQEVLDRLEAAGVRVFRTDRDGTTTFTSDGRQFTVRER